MQPPSPDETSSQPASDKAKEKARMKAELEKKLARLTKGMNFMKQLPRRLSHFKPDIDSIRETNRRERRVRQRFKIARGPIGRHYKDPRRLVRYPLIPQSLVRRLRKAQLADAMAAKGAE